MRIGMSSGKLQKRYWPSVSDSNCQEYPAFDVCKRFQRIQGRKRTDVRIVVANVFVQPGLYVQIGDPRPPNSLLSNTSNATIVLPASAPTLGDWGDANLGGLSETPIVLSSTPTTAVSDIAGSVGEVLPTAVSDLPVALHSSEPTIESS